MSRRRRNQTPEERAEEARIRAQRKAEIAKLERHGDVRVVTGPGYEIIAAQRLDVFAMLHQRRSLTDTQLAAVRRLETDLHVAAGAEGDTEVKEFVQGSGCRERITQRMIDASAEVRRVMLKLHLWEAKLMAAFLSPTNPRSALTRWRQTVEQVTGATNPHKQSERVVVAVETLTAAYAEIDHAPARARA